jgi:hypothetical protein
MGCHSSLAQSSLAAAAFTHLLLMLTTQHTPAAVRWLQSTLDN